MTDKIYGLQRRTTLMNKAENYLDGPLSKTLAPFVTEHGLTGASKRLQVGKGVLQHWMAALGISTLYVAVGPDDVMQIHRDVDDPYEEVKHLIEPIDDLNNY